MIKAEIYNYKTHNKEIYYFNNSSELIEFLLDNNVTLISSKDILGGITMMNIKGKEEQSIKSNIKSGNIIETDKNNYYLITDVPSTNKFRLFNIINSCTLHGELTQEEIYKELYIKRIYTNSDLILK